MIDGFASRMPGIPFAQSAEMKRNPSVQMSIAAAFVSFAIANAAAHVENQAAESTKNATASSQITVIGCVQNFSSSDVNGHTDHGFLLSNATTSDGQGGSAPPPRPPAARPTSGNANESAPGALAHPSSRGNNYKLEGAATELKEQVNHKVEVTGTVEARGENETDAAKNATEPRLTVTAVRMVASGCAAK